MGGGSREQGGGSREQGGREQGPPLSPPPPLRTTPAIHRSEQLFCICPDPNFEFSEPYFGVVMGNNCVESTSILDRTTESERGLMVGGIYNYLTKKNKHNYEPLCFQLTFQFRNAYWGIAYGKITIRILEDKLVRFLVQESQSQSSSHEFLLFDTQYLPCISTLSNYLSSHLHPETTHIIGNTKIRFGKFKIRI